MDWILKKTGITRSWLAEQMNWGNSTVNYAFDTRGFSKEELKQIQYILKLAGKDLKSFKFTNNPTEDFKQIRKRFGIKKITWAEALNVGKGTFNTLLIRQSGLTLEEKEILRLTKDSIANDLLNFKLSEIKKVA